jgi:dCMP deaminase
MRPSWDQSFMDMAFLVAQRASCPRLNVGAVIVRDKRVLATGYNGAPSGRPNCLSVGCHIVNNSCHRAVHAEANALLSATRHGVPTDGAMIYVTHKPCLRCIQLIQQAGIVQVFFGVDVSGGGGKRVEYGDLILDHDYVQRRGASASSANCVKKWTERPSKPTAGKTSKSPRTHRQMNDLMTRS